jgi:hypothetical protein
MASIYHSTSRPVNWEMKRTNTFVVRPLSDDGEEVLRQLLDASAALWNEINYQRLMRYNDEDGFEGDVWDADTGALALNNFCRQRVEDLTVIVVHVGIWGLPDGIDDPVTMRHSLASKRRFAVNKISRANALIAS